MPNRCVVGGCNNDNYSSNVSLHVVPKEPKVREKWIRFIQNTRIDFPDSLSSCTSVCSKHFKEDDFVLSWRLCRNMGYERRRFLVPEAFPTILNGEVVPLDRSVEELSSRLPLKCSRRRKLTLFAPPNASESEKLMATIESRKKMIKRRNHLNSIVNNLKEHKSCNSEEQSASNIFSKEESSPTVKYSAGKEQPRSIALTTDGQPKEKPKPENPSVLVSTEPVIVPLIVLTEGILLIPVQETPQAS